VDRFPNKIATVFGSQQLSFREIDGLSGSLARSLRDLHVTKGDWVAPFMTNRPETAGPAALLSVGAQQAVPLRIDGAGDTRYKYTSGEVRIESR